MTWQPQEPGHQQAQYKPKLHRSFYRLLRKDYHWICHFKISFLFSDDGNKLKCEFCGKVDLATKFRRSKRFCSMACAKRYNVGCSKRLGLFKSQGGEKFSKKRREEQRKSKGWKRGKRGRVSTGPIERVSLIDINCGCNFNSLWPSDAICSAWDSLKFPISMLSYLCQIPSSPTVFQGFQ